MIDKVVNFPASNNNETLLVNELLGKVYEYTGKVTLAAALGALELVKITIVEDAIGAADDE